MSAISAALASTSPATTAPRRHESGLAGRLNAEWSRICADPVSHASVARWGHDHETLGQHPSPAAIEQAVRKADRHGADDILRALLNQGHNGDPLAHRTVLQLMLGKAIRIAATHSGRDSWSVLEETAITALWTVIASYPIERRPTKIAANIAMDTVRLTTAELAHQRHEAPIPAPDLSVSDPGHRDIPPDLELAELLAWAVDTAAITAAEATLLLDVYAPGSGERGGSAAAERHGLSWATARQRCSRAVRKVATAVRADHPTADPA